MKISYVLTAFAVSAVVSTSAMAGGFLSAGGSYTAQSGAAVGIYATGGAAAQGSVDVGTHGGNSSVNNTSSSGSLNGVGGGVVAGGNGSIGGIGVVAAAGGVSASNNNVQTSNTHGEIQSNTVATNSSGVGLGYGAELDRLCRRQHRS